MEESAEMQRNWGEVRSGWCETILNENRHTVRLWKEGIPYK